MSHQYRTRKLWKKSGREFSKIGKIVSKSAIFTLSFVKEKNCKIANGEQVEHICRIFMSYYYNGVKFSFIIRYSKKLI